MDLRMMNMKQSVIAALFFILMGSVCVFGEITYTLDQSVLNANSTIRAEIETAIAQAVGLYNQWGSFNKHIYIYYVPSVPTADGNYYTATIRFGGSRSTCTALHEIGHILGVGYETWSDNIQAGKWTGSYANAKIQELDGAGAMLYADSMHFWPYGLNFETEDGSMVRIGHIMMLANLRADMGFFAITEEPQSQTLASGSTAVFEVVAPGATSYEWYKQPSGTPLTDGGDISGATTDTLTISNVDSADAGYYYCLVSDSLASSQAQLCVDHWELYERRDCTLIKVRGSDAYETGNKFLTGTNPPTITALGFIDLANTDPTIAPDGDGLLQSHRVTLWLDSNGSKVTEVTVPAGTAGDLINGFRYVDIPEGSLTLAANTAYVISADTTDIQDPWLDEEELTPGIYYIDENVSDSTTWQGRWGTSGTRPDDSYRTGTFYGLVNITSEDSQNPDTTPPAAPTNLAATAGNGSVSLDWDDNSEPDLDSYNVYRHTTSGGPYSQIATDVTNSNYIDNTVTNGTTYYYVVTAVDTSTNESNNSNEASATPQAGAEPDMYVNDISMSYRQGGQKYYGQATVWIKDDTGANVAGATVYGNWSGATNQSVSGITQSDGTVFFESAGVRGGGTYTFTVTDVVKTGYVYNASLNVETSDSITAP